MATLKLEKKTAFPFFILHECGDGVRRVAEKVSRDVIGVTDTQTEVSVVEICAKGKKRYTASFSGGICCDGWLRRKGRKAFI